MVPEDGLRAHARRPAHDERHGQRAIKRGRVHAFAADEIPVGEATRVQEQEHIYAQAGQLPAKPYPSVEGIKSMMEIYNHREMRMHQPDDFYDASFVSELDKSGYIDGLYRK